MRSCRGCSPQRRGNTNWYVELYLLVVEELKNSIGEHYAREGESHAGKGEEGFTGGFTGGREEWWDETEGEQVVSVRWFHCLANSFARNRRIPPVIHATIARMAGLPALGHWREMHMQQMHPAQGAVHHWQGHCDPAGSTRNGTSTQEGAHHVATNNRGGAGGGGNG